MLIPQQRLQLLLTLLAQWNHRLLPIVEQQCIAVARVLNNGLDVLQVYEISTMRFEKATCE